MKRISIEFQSHYTPVYIVTSVLNRTPGGRLKCPPLVPIIKEDIEKSL